MEKDQDLMLPVGGAGKGKPRTTNPFNRSVQRSDILADPCQVLIQNPTVNNPMELGNQAYLLLIDMNWSTENYVSIPIK